MGPRLLTALVKGQRGLVYSHSQVPKCPRATAAYWAGSSRDRAGVQGLVFLYISTVIPGSSVPDLCHHQ